MAEETGKQSELTEKIDELEALLIEHRDMMFQEHIGLPLNFLSEPAG